VFCDLSPGVPITTTQRCGGGDAVSLVVVGVPPATAAGYALIDVDVDAEMENSVVHRVGSTTLLPHPTAGSRVAAVACVPGVRTWRVTWRLSSSDANALVKVGLHASIGGAGPWGLVCLDAQDLPGSAALYPFVPAGNQQQLSAAPCWVGEVWGTNRGPADTIVQIHDGPMNAGDTPADAFLVPAGGVFHRAYPPRLHRRRLCVGASLAWDVFTVDPAGNINTRARLITR
jgi:hypothetical protein